MSNFKKNLFLLCGVLIVLGIQFVVYGLSRSTGDLIYIGSCVALCGLVVWYCRSAESRIIALMQGLLGAFILLTLNSYWADFVRNNFFDLGEDFGASATRGFVIFFVVLPLIVLTGIVSAIFLPSRNASHW